MHISRDGHPCHVEIARRWQGPVFADGGDDGGSLGVPIQNVLTKQGFVEQRQAHYHWFELPPGLEEREENARATRAAVALARAGYQVALDPELHDAASATEDRPSPTAEPEAG